MPREAVIVVVAACAGLLALWFDVRFPQWGAKDLRGAVIRAVGAYALFLASPMLFDAVATEDPWSRVGALLAIQVPILVYTLLACLWLLKVFRGAVAGLR